MIRDNTDAVLLIAKISRQNYLIEFLHYQFFTNKLQSVVKFTAGKWLDYSSCYLISSNYFICIDQKDLEFQLMDLSDQNRQFKRIPLSTFGLTLNFKSDSIKLSLKILPDFLVDKTTTISKSMSATNNAKYFVLNLGNSQGIVLFKIVPELQDNTGGASIRLVKIFPYAMGLTIIPLISSLQETVNAQNDFEKLDFGVAVIFSKNESIPYEDPNDGKYQQKVFAFKLAIFHLESWNEITSISSKSILLEFGSKQSIEPINSNGKLVKRLNDKWEIDKFEIIPIRSLIQNSRSGRDQYRYTYKMLLSTIDGTMIVANLMGKVNWAREEALAEINSLIMLDLPLSETDATLEQEYGFDEKQTNIIAMFVHRIKSQLLQLMTHLKQAYQWLIYSLIRLNLKRNSKYLPHFDDDGSSGDQDDSSVNFYDNEDDDNEVLIRDYFGFHKIILARTKIGKLFALDTLSGRIIWSKHIASLAVDKLVALFKKN